ncbi:MAG: mechanosensitive ion channel domain-containing protein [Gammaproteobacteria bacterium]|jgi:miniconductance mechanosensitive channel
MLFTEKTILQHIESFYTQLNFTHSHVLLASSITIVIGVFIISYISNFITKRILLSASDRFLKHTHKKILFQLSHMVPALIIYAFVPWMIVDERSFTLSLEHIIRKIVEIYMVINMTLILSALSTVAEEYYCTIAFNKQRPIKSYIEIAKILLYMVAAILVGSIIVDKSPVALLTGLGAVTAVLSLVFRDFILGLVASLQIGSHDLIRLGDRIEVPEYGADGFVSYISLNTVKVQNLDNTIVSIPTYVLTNTQLKNWRGMLDAGGRQIKRAINIDMHSIRYCDKALLETLKQTEHVKDYFISSCQKFETAITNLGVFRAYLQDYLRNHPDLHKHMTCLVSQLAPSPEGLPIEVYVFSHHLEDNEYESLQADLFDHILAILPYFGLRVFQNSTDFSANNNA